MNFPFIGSNIPAAPADGVYISQLIRYSRACGSHQDFLGRGLMLTRKLLNQGFLLVKLKSSLRNCMEYLCHKWPRICSTCCKHFPVLSSFMTITGFVTRLTRQVPLVQQELLTLPEHLSSPPVFCGVCVTWSCYSTKNRRIPVLEKVSWKGHQFLLNYWHPTWYMIRSKDELYLRQMEHIGGHLWHIYFVTVNQVLRPYNWRSDDFKLSTGDIWSSSLLGKRPFVWGCRFLVGFVLLDL